MAEVTQEEREAEDQAWRNATSTVENYLCGECDGLLVVVRIDDEWAARCGRYREHETLSPIETTTEIARSGAGVPVYVQNAIDRTRPPVQTIELMAKIWQDRSMALTRGGALVAARYSLAIGLDPRFGEIACLEFGRGETKSPTVMITEKGWRTLATRECADIFDRAPVLTDVTDPERKKELSAKPEDFVCIAQGTLKGDHPELPIRRATGIYTAREHARDLDRKGPGGAPLPAAELPQNQARARASRHWYEQNTPQAPERARGAWSDAIKELDVEEAETIISAEWRWADEEPAQPSKQERSRSPSYQGERQGGSESRPAATTTRSSSSSPPPSTQRQHDSIKGLAMRFFGWDEQDIVKEIGKPLAELTVAEAGQMITAWEEREKEASREAGG